MQQVNVLHVIDHMGMGGAQRIVSELLNKWDDEKIKMFCYALRASNNEFGTKSKGIFFTSNHKSKYNIFSLFELKKIIEAENINILHLHLQKATMFGILIKQIYHKDLKIIVHEHGQIFKNTCIYNNFLNIFENKIDLFIAVSEETKRLLIKNAKIKNNKIRMFYNFVDLSKFNPEKLKQFDRNTERKKIDLNMEDYVIGFVGRLDKLKGCDVLLRSIQYVKKSKCKVVIAGDGVEKKELEKLSENLKIADKISFLGFTDNIVEFYSLIDCLVVPSRSESFGLSAIEAQALGIPVIASDIKGLNEVVLDKNTGLLFESENEEDLAEKIELMHSNESLKIELTKNGLKNVKKYSLNNYLIRLEGIYEKH